MGRICHVKPIIFRNENFCPSLSPTTLLFFCHTSHERTISCLFVLKLISH